MTTSVSVIVLTHNEEMNIGSCLDSVEWCDDVVVIDSFSTDRTQEIVRNRNVRVVEHRFENYAKQRNFALTGIRYKYEWVLMLDADEMVPEGLHEEIASVIDGVDTDVAMFRMRRRDYFMGRWIKYSTSYNTLWFGRLMRLGKVWIERSINEEYHTTGTVRDLKSDIMHYPFNKGFDSWVEKHNRYSRMEAELIVSGAGYSCRFSDLAHSDPVKRRKALKSAVYSLPGRPVLMFFGRYLFTGGFLDGRPGLTFCLLKTYYEFLIDCKVKELRRRADGLSL